MNTQFKLAGLDSGEIQRLVDLSDLGRYLFEVVSERFRQEHTLKPYDFFAIVIWKSNRTKTKIRDGLAAADISVDELMRQISQAETPQAKVEKLLQIWGIGVPIASAILAVCYPDEFTVLDRRVWEVLQQRSIEGLPERFPKTPTKYLQYCSVCRSLADQSELTLRELDRVLWAKSWENGLLDLVEGLE